MGRTGKGRGFIERPAWAGDRGEIVDESEGEPLRASEGDHSRVVGTMNERRCEKAESLGGGERLQGAAHDAVCRHASGDDEARGRNCRTGLPRFSFPADRGAALVSQHGDPGAVGEMARDRGLGGGGEVASLGVGGETAGDPGGRGFQPREGEVASGAAAQGAWERESIRVSPLRQPLEGGSGRIGEAERAPNLVKSFAGGVVDGRAKPAAGSNAGHGEKLAVAAGHQQQKEGVGNVLGQTRRDGVALEVVDRDQRFPERHGHGLCEREPDHHSADQAGTCRGRDAVEIDGMDAGLGEGAEHHDVDSLDVGAGRDLRHYASKRCVVGNLGEYNGGEDPRQTAVGNSHDRGGRFVAARFDAQHGETHERGGRWRRKEGFDVIWLPPWAPSGSGQRVMTQRVRIGTRGSKLALTQAGWVRDKIGEGATLVTITTSGDRLSDRRLADVGGKGLFTKEIEEALIDGRIDCAVHSLKDMPAGGPVGLTIGAIPEREDPRDAFVSERFASFESLPKRARLGTASLRRAAQALHRRPDLEIVPSRGNVDTRLARLTAGEFDAVLLAMAGLKRLGLGALARTLIDPVGAPPAPGQGALAIQVREEDAGASWLAALKHGPTMLATEAERGAMAALEGSCRTAVGAYGRVEWGQVLLTVEALTPDGARRFRREGSSDVSRGVAGARALGLKLGEAIAAEGGESLVAWAQGA